MLLAGKLVPGADQDRAAAALAKMTGLDPAKTRLLLCSGKPRLAKRGLTPAAGEALVAKFAALGIAALIRPSAATGAGAGTAAAAQGASPAAARAAAPPMPEKIEGLTMDWSVPKEKPERFFSRNSAGIIKGLSVSMRIFSIGTLSAVSCRFRALR